MKSICSDTNIWLDFYFINRLELPFYLPYTYLMSEDALNEEVLFTDNLKDKLLTLGLCAINISSEEFDLALEYAREYPKLSTHDCTALAISKHNNIMLLTGDKSLRTAAKRENVDIVGTLGILDQLFDGNFINEMEFEYCLKELERLNKKIVRLPDNEIKKRLDKLKIKV